MTGFLDRLARGGRVRERVVVVVAHPDDETLAAGSRFDRMDDLAIVHITDGSPRDLEDARREGFPTREGYAAHRRRELVAAMDALGASPELLCHWHPDKESVLHAAAILDQLAEDIADAAFVITHAYEHGHPDHDTAALCVRLARDRLVAARAPAPGLYEFPIYAMQDGKPVFGRFAPDPDAPETVLPMTADDRARRNAALAAFATQRGLLRFAGGWEERLRPMAPYDFRRPAPAGSAWYDRHHWVMTLARWREHADALLDREGA